MVLPTTHFSGRTVWSYWSTRPTNRNNHLQQQSPTPTNAPTITTKQQHIITSSSPTSNKQPYSITATAPPRPSTTTTINQQHNFIHQQQHQDRYGQSLIGTPSTSAYQQIQHRQQQQDPSTTTCTRTTTNAPPRCSTTSLSTTTISTTTAVWTSETHTIIFWCATPQYHTVCSTDLQTLQPTPPPFPGLPSSSSLTSTSTNAARKGASSRHRQQAEGLEAERKITRVIHNSTPK